MEKFNGKALYNPAGKAGEYAAWACNFYVGCSHGAGRRMGRKEAQRTLDLEAEKKLLDDQGIIHGIKEVSDLDEAASAYKDIDIVIANEKDLVETIVELHPLAVIKG